MQPYEIAWSSDLDLAGPVSLVAGASHLIVVGGRGPVEGRDLQDGRQTWTWGDDLTPEGAPIAGDGLAFVVSAGSLYALDEAAGRPRWSTPIAGGTPPIWRAGWILVASGSELRAYRAVDGTAVWKTGLGSPVVGSPAIDGTRVFVVLADRRLVSLEITTGHERWTVPLDVTPGALLAATDRVYFGAEGHLYCYTQDDGRYLWAYPVRTEVIGRPVSDGQHVLFTGFDNVLWALDAHNGSVRWSGPLASRAVGRLFLEAGHVVVPLATGELLFFLAADGRPAGRLAAPRSGDDAPGVGIQLEAVDSADSQRLFRVTHTAAGSRTLCMYRRGTLPLSPPGSAFGAPVDLVAPRAVAVRR